MPHTSMSKAQDDFLREEDCIPNLNAATIAGRVIEVKPLTGRTPGLAVTVGYMKHWPNGGRQEIPVRLYLTGQERLDKLDWLKVGEVVLAYGQITDRGAVYCHQLEWLSRPPRQPGDGDQYLEGLQATHPQEY